MLVSISCLLAGAASALKAQSTDSALWKVFLTRPSEATYEPLSKAIQACVAMKCSDEALAGEKDNFADFYRLLSLAERGNPFAMELGFQIRPLYKNIVAPSEDLDNSLGLSSTREPTFFLRLVRKYKVSTFELQYLVVQTSQAAIDHPGRRRKELRRRIRSFSKVADPSLVPLRQKAISIIEQDIKQFWSSPGDP